MVIPSIGAVVLVQFPFSDLTDVKLRPAVVLAAPLPARRANRFDRRRDRHRGRWGIRAGRDRVRDRRRLAIRGVHDRSC